MFILNFLINRFNSKKSFKNNHYLKLALIQARQDFSTPTLFIF